MTWRPPPGDRPSLLPRRYFRRKAGELLADMVGGIAATAPPPPSVSLPTTPAPVTPAPPARPAVGFGGGGAPQTATAPESTATFAPGSTTVQSIVTPSAVVGAGAHSRLVIRNLGPGPAWLGDVNVNGQTGEYLRAGDELLYNSSAGVWAIASPAQPATLAWRLET